jgi:hypothetical protein
MMRNLTIAVGLTVAFFCLLPQTSYAQLESYTTQLIDYKSKEIPFINHDRRSSANPTACGIDTVDFPRFRARALQTVTMFEGRGLGQFYGAPQKITLHGATFYAFIAGNPPPVNTTKVFVNLYRADADSLPTGSPLRSDTVTIDTVFGNGQIVTFERHASFRPIDIDFDYIVVVETPRSDTFRVAVVTNNWNQNDGRGDFFNCGSINGIWYRGRNLNIGNAPFDADILINPHVSYRFGTDFDIVSQCFSIGDTVKFLNNNRNSVVSSPFYNRYAFSNQEMFSHAWNYGLSPFSASFTIDGENIYQSNQAFDVRLASRIFQWQSNNGIRWCHDTAIQTLYPKPLPPTLSGGGIKCEGDRATIITKTDITTTNRWVLGSSDTLGYASGDTFITGSLFKDTFFYARATNGVCMGDVSTTGIQVFTYPFSPTVINDSVCAGSRANLTAFSANALTVEWFRDTLSPPFFIGSVFQTPTLQQDTSFYVRATNFGCNSTGFVRVSALVGQDFAPQEPDVFGDTSVCMLTSPRVTFQAFNTGDPLRWFDVPSGGNPIGNGNSFLYTPTQKGTFVFYVESWNGNCGSSRIPVSVNVDELPSLTSATGDEVCFGRNAVLRGSIPFGQIQWFTSATGGNPVGTGNELQVFGLTQNTTYYLERQSGLCVSITRTPVNIMVNEPPGFFSLTGDTICSRSRAMLKSSITNPAGLVRWYENATDTQSIGTGPFFETPSLLGSRSYFASAEFKGCVSPRLEVRPVVNPRPFSGFFFDVLTDQRIRLTPLTTSGVSFNWNFGDGNTSSETGPTHTYQDSGWFNVRLILTSMFNQCKDTTTNEVYVPYADPASVSSILSQSFRLYPNPANHTLWVDAGDNRVEHASVSLFDFSGKQVLNIPNHPFSIQPRLEINTSNFTSGVYYVRIGHYFSKVIIQH